MLLLRRRTSTAVDAADGPFGEESPAASLIDLPDGLTLEELAELAAAHIGGDLRSGELDAARDQRGRRGRRGGAVEPRPRRRRAHRRRHRDLGRVRGRRPPAARHAGPAVGQRRAAATRPRRARAAGHRHRARRRARSAWCSPAVAAGRAPTDGSSGSSTSGSTATTCRPSSCVAVVADRSGGRHRGGADPGPHRGADPHPGGPGRAPTAGTGVAPPRHAGVSAAWWRAWRSCSSPCSGARAGAGDSGRSSPILGGVARAARRRARSRRPSSPGSNRCRPASAARSASAPAASLATGPAPARSCRPWRPRRPRGGGRRAVLGSEAAGGRRGRDPRRRGRGDRSATTALGPAGLAARRCPRAVRARARRSASRTRGSVELRGARLHVRAESVPGRVAGRPCRCLERRRRTSGRDRAYVADEACSTRSAPATRCASALDEHGRGRAHSGGRRASGRHRGALRRTDGDRPARRCATATQLGYGSRAPRDPGAGRGPRSSTVDAAGDVLRCSRTRSPTAERTSSTTSATTSRRAPSEGDRPGAGPREPAVGTTEHGGSDAAPARAHPHRGGVVFSPVRGRREPGAGGRRVEGRARHPHHRGRSARHARPVGGRSRVAAWRSLGAAMAVPVGFLPVVVVQLGVRPQGSDAQRRVPDRVPHPHRRCCWSSPCRSPSARSSWVGQRDRAAPAPRADQHRHLRVSPSVARRADRVGEGAVGGELAVVGADLGPAEHQRPAALLDPPLGDGVLLRRPRRCSGCSCRW